MYLNKNKKVRKYQDGTDGVVPSEKTNWWDDKNYAQYYDFASDKNVNRDLLSHRNTSPTSGRHKRFFRYLQAPEATSFSSDYEGYNTFSKDKSTNQQFTHPRDLTEMIFNLDEDQVEKILNRGWVRPVFDLHSDPVGRVDGDGYADKNLRRNFDPNRKGQNQRHIRDVNRINEITGWDIQPGNEAFLLMQNLANSNLLEDALMAKFPNLDPGTKRGRYRVREGLNPGKGGMGGQYINAPADYIMNMEASGMDPRYVSNEWLNVQHTFSESGGDEKKMFEALINNPDVQKYMTSRTDGRHLPSAVFRDDEGNWKDARNTFSKGVTILSDGRYISDFERRELTDAERKHWQKGITNKYIEDSGWVNAASQKTNLESKEGPSQFEVPSNKGVITPGPGVTPLSFNEGDDDTPFILTDDMEMDVEGIPEQGEDINILNTNKGPIGTVSVDPEEMRRLNFPQGGGEPGGGEPGGGDGETITNAREKGLKDQSINAVITSMKNKTHVKTGEGYNQADLDRDAKIIKDRFGDDAYQDLLGQVGNIGAGEPSSDNSVVTTQGGGGDGDNKTAMFKSAGKSVAEDIGGDDDESFSEVVSGSNDEGSSFFEGGDDGTGDGDVNIETPELEMVGDYSDVIAPEIVSPFPDADLELMPGSSSAIPFAKGGRLNKMYMKNGGRLNKMYMKNGGALNKMYMKGGGKINKKKSLNGFYDKEGNFVENIYREGGHLHFDIPTIYERRPKQPRNSQQDEEYWKRQGIIIKKNRLDKDIEEFSQSMDANNDSDVTKLNQMKAESDNLDKILNKST